MLAVCFNLCVGQPEDMTAWLVPQHKQKKRQFPAQHVSEAAVVLIYQEQGSEIEKKQRPTQRSVFAEAKIVIRFEVGVHRCLLALSELHCGYIPICILSVINIV